MDAFKRKENGQFVEGTLPGPGRPAGKTLKEFARDFYKLKTDDEKKAYLATVEDKRPGFAWEMAEGKAAQGLGQDPNLEPIKLIVEVIHSNAGNNANP